MSWTTSTADLRSLLADGPTNKLHWRKKVFGIQDGSNKDFKTFEFRRTTNFVTSSTGGLGVFVNNVLATATADTPEIGQVTLSAAPANTALVEATYYSQWFTDTELVGFIDLSVTWLGLATGTVSQIPDGLRAAVLNYASGEAYQHLALRYARQYSEMYRLEDSQDPKSFKIVEAYQKAAQDNFKKATELRDHFYTRQGQSLAPLYATNSGCVRDTVPRS